MLSGLVFVWRDIGVEQTWIITPYDACAIVLTSRGLTNDTIWPLAFHLASERGKVRFSSVAHGRKACKPSGKGNRNTAIWR